MNNPPYIIWTPGKPRVSLPENTTYLRLVPWANNAVMLIACNRHGERLESGSLIRFDADKIIHMCSNIGDRAHMRLDLRRRLLVAD